MKRYTKGFTLIELLVVIAIIGILASVVLVSLQSARKRGNDARVISSVQQIRTALETDYNGSAYPGLTSTTATNRFAGPATAGTNVAILVTDIISQQTSGLYGADAAGAIVANGTVVITKNNVSPGTGYAIYAKLPSDQTKSFCIDSRGGTKNPATYPAAAPADDTVATTCQ